MTGSPLSSAHNAGALCFKALLVIALLLWQSTIFAQEEEQLPPESEPAAATKEVAAPSESWSDRVDQLIEG